MKCGEDHGMPFTSLLMHIKLDEFPTPSASALPEGVRNARNSRRSLFINNTNYSNSVTISYRQILISSWQFYNHFHKKSSQKIVANQRNQEKSHRCQRPVINPTLNNARHVTRLSMLVSTVLLLVQCEKAPLFVQCLTR